MPRKPKVTPEQLEAAEHARASSHWNRTAFSRIASDPHFALSYRQIIVYDIPECRTIDPPPHDPELAVEWPPAPELFFRLPTDMQKRHLEVNGGSPCSKPGCPFCEVKPCC